MSLDVTVLLFASVLAQDGPKTPGAEEVLEAAISQRRAITRGTVKLRFVSEYPIRVENPVTTGEMQLWVDGHRLRSDISHTFDPKEPLWRNSYGLNCQKEGHYVIYSEPKGKEQVSVRLGKIGDENQKGHLAVADFRALGMNPAGIAGTLRHYQLDSELGRADRTKPTLERARWQENECWIVRYTWLTAPKGKIAIWIVPSMDHSVVKMELEIQSMGRHEKEVAEFNLKRYGKKGIWYPKSCTYVAHHDGKFFSKAATEVLEATFNEPIPADTFGFAGMKIPPGTPVNGSGVPAVGRYVWDGRDIVEVPKGPQMPASVPSSNRTWLLVLGGALTLTAGAACWLLLRKSKAARAA